MSKFHFNRIESNIKGSGVHELPEARQIHLYGRNGSGKSAIVHSIEYALTGVVGDIAGRDVKRGSYLESMTPQNGPVRVHLDPQPDKTYINVMFNIMAVLRGSNTALVEFLANEYSPRKYIRWKAKRKRVTQIRAKVKALLDERGVLQKYALKDACDAVARELVDLDADLMAAKAEEREAFAEVLEQIEGPIRQKLRDAGLEIADLGNEWRLCLKGAGSITSGAEQVYAAVLLGLLVYPVEDSLYVLPDRAYDQYSLAEILAPLVEADALAVGQGTHFFPLAQHNYHVEGGGIEAR